MDKYKDANGGRDPISIVVFRDGVRGASDYQSLSKEGVSLAFFCAEKENVHVFSSTPTPRQMLRDISKD